MKIRLATSADLLGVAQLFHAAFSDSIHHIWGPTRTPNLDLTATLFAVCLQSEPDAFWTAVDKGQIVGYLFAPAHLSLSWRPVRLVTANKLYTDLRFRQVGTMTDSQGDWSIMLRDYTPVTAD